MAESNNLPGLAAALQALQTGLARSPSQAVRTVPPGTSFSFRNVPPPAHLHVSREDTLRFEAVNSASGIRIALSGKFLSVSGEVNPFRIEMSPSSDRTSTIVAQRLGEGFLINVFCEVLTGTVRRGQCYVNVTMRHGSVGDVILSSVLFSDYLTNRYRPFWPISVPANPLGAEGFTRVVIGTNPAAGVEPSETVPSNTLWLLRLIKVTLVTANVGGNRNVTLIISRSGDSYINIPAQNFHALNDTLTYVWAFPLGYFNATGFAGIFLLGLPEIYLTEGNVITFSTSGFEATDNYSAPTMYVEEWLDV